jgi:LPXTG-motif cell wall-anchored protein
MSIVNRRNAVLGWLTWSVGKKVAKKKAKGAVPAIEDGKPNKPAALAAGLAALGGAVFFWRRRRRASSPDAPAGE